jgi:hypothetical protein
MKKMESKGNTKKNTEERRNGTGKMGGDTDRIRQNKTDSNPQPWTLHPPTCNCTEEIIRVEAAALLVFRDPAFHFRLHPRQVGLQSRVYVRWQNL